MADEEWRREKRVRDRQRDEIMVRACRKYVESLPEDEGKKRCLVCGTREATDVYGVICDECPSHGWGTFTLDAKPEPAARGVCEAKVAAVLESLSEDELAYLYAVALYEGRGLRYDACISRLRRVGWR